MIKNPAQAATPGIRVVVMEPGGPVNIGSIARIMANFGFSDLVLVGGKDSDEEGRGARVSMGGIDVYNGRRTVDCLDTALEGCGLVIGATRRARVDESCIDFREAAVVAARRACTTTVALLLGRERDGLSREERNRCHLLAEVPTVPGTAGSLNISHAAAIILCGIHCARLGQAPDTSADPGALISAFDDLFKRCGRWEDNGRAQVVFRGLVERGRLTPEEARLLESSFRFFGSRIKQN